MSKHKAIIAICLLSITIIASYLIPKVKYVSTNFISTLNIPLTLENWKGQDVSSVLEINTEETKFNFINEAIAYNYTNRAGNNLLFIVLDAGNFHHPKVCFTSAGFKLKELPDTEFNLQDMTFKVHTLFTERENDTFLSFYWIVIDKDIAHEWIEQKYKQLYFSILNKKRVGLMVRIDIPSSEDQIDDAMIMARNFISDLSRSLNLSQASYIFGTK